MQPTLRDAYRAARQQVRGTSTAITLARRRLADLPTFAARVDAARAAVSAVVDKRRFNPENVAAQTELRAATAVLSQLRRTLTPRDKGDSSATLGAPFAIGGHATAVGTWCENPPFRFAGLASDIVSLRHTGWFTAPDGFDGETARGVVYQATGRDGRARYIPAIADPCNSSSDGTGPAVLAIAAMVIADGSDESAGEESLRDAARRADQLAEYYAESEREYQAAWQAGSQWAELGAEVADTRRALLELLRERREVQDVQAPTICAVLRAKVADMVESIAEARRARARLAAGDGGEYASFWTGDKRLRSAFNDGAEETVLA